MKIWAVGNQKGGVGKTTTAVSVAGILSLRGQRTLLVDLDVHASLTAYLGLDPDRIDASVYRLFQQEPVRPLQLISQTRFKRLHLLPASTAMATLDRQLGAQNGKGRVISNALQQLKDIYDFVVIDCPPTLGILLVNALVACEHLIIPVQTEFLALKGLERMEHTLSMLRQSMQRELPYTIVPTMFDQRTKASYDSLGVLRSKYQTHLWNAFIPIDTQFRDASHQGIPLPLRNMSGRGALAYSALVDSLWPEGRREPLQINESSTLLRPVDSMFKARTAPI